ncbi:MAG TPA: carboxypeptidase regulatory-like domain-containing protein [Candidatus Paceibacterota bacterium]|nr:carboxypeptidase regulatory-like domain-containing protein [Verrucomicrobiota bacterium]HRY47588.1 carboxypeptidase regulatory-like domain-containing protein [Candidatus Paceibacterota bacterium]HSA02169.1 carboxypeptidase regulatory-like domain-containing protein [Candidatus Paceibacterota bacterium]
MMTNQRMLRIIAWTASVLMAVIPRLAGQNGIEAEAPDPGSLLDQQERQVDRENFRRIYQAIQGYRKDHQGQPPDWLSDLVPGYLGDTNCLMSPTHKRLGEVSQYFIPDPKLPTSYNYEFNATPASRFIENPGQNAGTMKDWKTRQMEVFGSAVPLVRYLHPTENRALNLAWSGEIYETQIGWETHTNTLALVGKDLAEGRLKPFPIATNLLVRVVDSGRAKEIQGAELTAVINTDRGWFPLQKQVSDNRGQSLIPLPRILIASVHIAVTAQGYLSQQTTLSNFEKAAPSSYTFELSKGIQISGTVADTNGRPVSGAVVVIPSSPFRTETDVNGHWVLDGLPVGFRNFSVTVTHPDFRTERVRASESGMRVVLHPRTIFQGTVIDAATGQGIRKFKITRGEELFRGVRWHTRKGYDNARGRFTLKFDEDTPRFLLFEAEGYEPTYHDCTALPDSGTALEIKLAKATAVSGQVVDRDGKPVPGAQVAVIDQFSEVTLGDGQLLGDPEKIATLGNDGRFQMLLPPRAYALVVAHPEGYAEASCDDVRRSGKIVLQPWSLVKGRLAFAVEQPFPSLVMLSRGFALPELYRGPCQGRLAWDFNTFVREGVRGGQSFEWPRITPGTGVCWKACFVNLTEWSPENIVFTGIPFKAKESTPAEVLWEKGFRLKSRFVSSQPQQWNTLMGFLLDKSDAASVAKSPAMAFTLTQEGAFCVDGISLQFKALELRLFRPPVMMGRVTVNEPASLPNTPAGREIDQLELVPVTPVASGQDAPHFELPACTGTGSVRLSDFKGHYVLLEFWSSWAQPGLASADLIQSVIGNAGSKGSLVVVGINLDEDKETARRCIELFGMHWPQAWLGPWWMTDLPARYGIDSLPSACLVSPQSRLMAVNLGRADLRETLKKQLRPE